MNRLLPIRIYLISAMGMFLLVLFALLAGLASSSPAAAQDDAAAQSPEQELVERFAPIVRIRPLLENCTHRGEQFRPVPVEIVFGSPGVRLMQRGENGAPDQVITTAPVAQDLAGLDSSYYLDLPGNPRDPKCTYQDWSNARMKELGIEPSIYGRVATEEGLDGLVIQYWFYWSFNLFNDTHESDWEGIQLNFSANTVQEILDNNLVPDSVAFAQHGGGELGDWDDDKVELEDTHIVVHPSSGSHASYFNATTWLGWGENGSGFGCDITEDPDFEVPAQVILIPQEIDPTGEFAWLTFEGRWGELEPSVFNGPTGPNTKPRWNHPITWSQGIRENSLPVPAHATIGPSPSGVFCIGAEFGSRVMQYFPVAPGVVAGIVLLLFGLVMAVALFAWRYVWRAIVLYVQAAHVYLVLGVLAVPVAAISARAENRVLQWLRAQFAERGPSSDAATDLGRAMLKLGASQIQEVLMIALLAPAVAYATYQLSQGREAHTLQSWKTGALHMPAVFLASLINTALVTLLACTVILLPWAVYKGVTWFFVSQAIIIDDAAPIDARHVSARVVQGHWRRAVAIVLWIAIVTRLPGPLIGTLAMVIGGVSINTAEWISGIVYCMIFPIGIIASTLFYMNIKDVLAVPVQDSLIKRAVRRVRGGNRTVPVPA